MKAMIFAAGLGTRLHPLTLTRPKAMVEVNGKPLLYHVLMKLKQSGFDDILVNVHHFSDQIINYLNNNDFGVTIHISDETDKLLDTGGGIKKAADLFNVSEPILIHNVDIFSNANLQELYQTHITSKADATLLISTRKSSRNLLFDDNLRLSGWLNTNTQETKPATLPQPIETLQHYAFSGIHVISPSLIRQMDNYPDQFPIIDFYLNEMNKYSIKGKVNNELRLIDVGKIENLEEAKRFQ